MTFFVIGFMGRVGSSYLQGLLNSHPEVNCMGEILAPNLLRKSCIGIRQQLDQSIHASEKPVSGFKLAVSHINETPEVMEILGAHNYRVIHLTRKNRLDQFISMRLAQLNGIWRSDFGSYSVHSFTAEPQEIAASIKSLSMQDAELLRYFEGMPILSLSYEELVASDGHKATFGFLGITDCELESPYVRQRSNSSQRDAIENYDELLRHFKGTELEGYFEG